MYLIGLCGRSGSGKSTVCGFLTQMGVYCIDADKVCKSVYDTNAACVAELSARFGSDIVDNNGKIIRPLLAKYAFSTAENTAALNAISHKYITAAIMKEVSRAFFNGKRYVVLDAPTLFEAGLNTRCHATIAVIAKENGLINRLKQRDKLDVGAIKKRLKAQKSNRFLAKNCTAVIRNTGTLDSLRKSTVLAMLAVQLRLGAIKPCKEAKRYVLKKG